MICHFIAIDIWIDTNYASMYLPVICVEQFACNNILRER